MVFSGTEFPTGRCSFAPTFTNCLSYQMTHNFIFRIIYVFSHRSSSSKCYGLPDVMDGIDA